MALTLINRAGRTVGFTGTINSKNPTFYDSGSWKGSYSHRITVPAGTWLLNATLEGDGVFRTYAEGRGEIVPNANSVSRVLQFDTPADLYFEVANWTLEKDRKLLVTLTQAPPCVIAFWRVWGWHRGVNQNQPTAFTPSVYRCQRTRARQSDRRGQLLSAPRPRLSPGDGGGDSRRNSTHHHLAVFAGAVHFPGLRREHRSHGGSHRAPRREALPQRLVEQPRQRPGTHGTPRNALTPVGGEHRGA